MKKYVIIGNGVAGDSAAVTIREIDKEGEIHMFTREDIPFYYRPRLIDYLAKEAPVEKFTLHDEKWYANQNINLHLSTEITQITPGDCSVTISSGEVFHYDRLLIATGGYNFVPPIAGAESNREKVLTVRDKKDSDRILELAAQSKTVILIGGGLLGLETANALRKQGLAVRVVEFFPRLLPRQLDVEGAKILERDLVSRGFELYLGETSEKIEGKNSHLALQLKSGKVTEGDFIIVSAGIRCEMQLAQSAGIATNKGILVDDHMKTNVENIYAAGDAIEHRGALYGIWPPAKEQGDAAGSNMADRALQYTGTIFSHKLKVVGIDLVSLGEIDAENKLDARVMKDVEKGIYRKAVLSEALIRDNRLARLLFERSLSTFLEDEWGMKNLVEASEIHVQLLAYRALSRDDERAAKMCGDNLDILLGTLLRPLHRRTRIPAMEALLNAARSIESAQRIHKCAREALDLPDIKYPREELVGLIGHLLHRWPQLQDEKEKSFVYGGGAQCSP